MIDKTKRFWDKWWPILKQTAIQCNDDNITKLSASLSYSTIFSLPPLLIIIISLCGIFFGDSAVSGDVFRQIHGLIGNGAAIEVQDMLKDIKLSHNNMFAAVLGVVILVVGASSVFSEIQGSINYIWGIQAKPKRGLIKFLINRLISFSMIGAVGFLLLVGLIINTTMDMLDDRLKTVLPHLTVYVFYALNIGLLFIIITVLFTMIFKTLPDGKVAVKDSLVGASFTSVLFMIGKFAIGFYLGNSTIASVYGAAGSVIVILVWVYYSAIILYFGAEFTQVYANTHGGKIIPNNYSEYILKSNNGYQNP